VCGKQNWHKTQGVLDIIDQARVDGVEVTFDQYPYTAGSTMLSAILPPWAHDGGTEQLLARLTDGTKREQMKKEMAYGMPGWDSMSAWAGWDGIFVTSVDSEKNQCFIGKNMLEIASMMKKEDPADAALDLLLEEKNAVGMIDFVMTESSVAQIMAHPAGTIGSDGLLGGKPHPRAFGSFPRVLGKYVREEKILGLEEMIRRLTSQPARIIGLQDRGIIREGMKADIVIFDEQEIIDQATYDKSTQHPKGIEYVIVNGQVVIEKEKSFALPVGKVIRREYPAFTSYLV
jgi:N-acyl-D-amino-acid deacylase